MKIDLDRDILYEVPVSRRPLGGVVIRKDPDTGADVFMYRTQPGVYYSANGMQVSATMAKRAGFDTARLEKEREKKQKMRDFEAKYNEELGRTTKVVVVERNGYRLVDLGGNRYTIEDTEGMNMTPGRQAPTLQHGMDWLADFAGPEEVKDDDVRIVDDKSEGRADRRSEQNGPAGGVVRQPGYKKIAVSA